MPRKTPAEIYETEILDMPPGLERAVLRTLDFYHGLDHAIEKPTLLLELRKLGFGQTVKPDTFERQVRRQIVLLRKKGYLICASSGEGGYFIASNRAEYDEFAQNEYRAKIIDMSDTLRAMDEGARRLYGSAEAAQQPTLL